MRKSSKKSQVLSTSVSLELGTIKDIHDISLLSLHAPATYTALTVPDKEQKKALIWISDFSSNSYKRLKCTDLEVSACTFLESPYFTPASLKLSPISSRRTSVTLSFSLPTAHDLTSFRNISLVGELIRSSSRKRKKLISRKRRGRSYLNGEKQKSES